MSQQTKHWIFRWKRDGLAVTPSRRKSPEEVWEFAIEWLRPAGLKDDAEAERLVRREGDVIPDDPD